MADTRGIRAGRAFVELGVDDQIAKGLQKAEQRLMAFGTGLRSVGTKLAAIGASAVTALFGTAKTFADLGDSLDEMSARTGVSVETLSELGFAAELAGADLETLETGLRKMQKAITAAATGSVSATEALTRLGLTVADLAGLSPERQFKLIADRLSQVSNPTLRAALAMEVFGKSGTRLLPLIADGAQGLERFQEQARALGLTVSTETAKDAAVLADALDTVWRVLKQTVFAIGSARAPTITELTGTITRAVVAFTNWIKDNKALVVTAFKVAAGATAAGAALLTLGALSSALGAALGGLATIVTGVGTALGVIGSALAALVSPIGLVITAAVALGGTLLVVTGAGSEALMWLGAQFGILRDTVYKLIGGIADALAAGEITLAAQVLWAGLKLIWQQGTRPLLQIWNDFVFGGQALWVEFATGVQSLWAKLVGFLRSTWAKFSAWHAQTVEHTANWIAKRWLELQGLFDRALNVEAAKESVDQQSRQRLDELAAQEQADLSAVEQAKAKALADIAQRRDERLAEIGGADVENERRRRAALDQARADLDAARAAAAQKRTEVAAPAAPRRTAADPLEDQLAGLGDIMARKLSVTGTFNPLAVAGLGASDADERTARNTEQIAKQTKRLADAAITGGLTFA